MICRKKRHSEGLFNQTSQELKQYSNSVTTGFDDDHIAVNPAVRTPCMSVSLHLTVFALSTQSYLQTRGWPNNKNKKILVLTCEI